MNNRHVAIRHALGDAARLLRTAQEFGRMPKTTALLAQTLPGAFEALDALEKQQGREPTDEECKQIYHVFILSGATTSIVQVARQMYEAVRKVLGNDAPAVRVPYGAFTPDGFWKPNPLLTMTAVEQLQANIDAGFMSDVFPKEKK